MQNRRLRINAPTLKWMIFLAVFACLATWAIRGVLVRARRMSTVDASDSLFESIVQGSSAKAVVRLDSVKGKELKGTLLEKQSDTVYRVPFRRTAAVIAVLTPDASVVMGKRQDIGVGAVVQLAGTIGASHILQTNQVVILTGYIRLSQKAG